MTDWPPNLDYVKSLADDVSERSLFGSLSTSLASQTRDVVEELRLARAVIRAVADPGCVTMPPPRSVRDAMAAYELRYGKVPA